MEICILKFDGSRSAENALKDVIDAQGDRFPWLHDVGTIARPLLGRVRVGATFPDGQSKTFREGDLADAVADLGGLTGYYVSALAGPLGGMFAATNAWLAAGERGADMEQRLFHLDEVKKVLPRDSSALVLIGSPQTCDALVAAFRDYEPHVVRRDVADELARRLQAFHRRVAEQMGQAEAGGAPATH